MSTGWELAGPQLSTDTWRIPAETKRTTQKSRWAWPKCQSTGSETKETVIVLNPQVLGWFVTRKKLTEKLSPREPISLSFTPAYAQLWLAILKGCASEHRACHVIEDRWMDPIPLPWQNNNLQTWRLDWWPWAPSWSMPDGVSLPYISLRMMFIPHYKQCTVP